MAKPVSPGAAAGYAAAVRCLIVVAASQMRAQATPSAAAPEGSLQTVRVVDMVRTRPGVQAEYLRRIEAQWGTARELVI